MAHLFIPTLILAAIGIIYCVRWKVGSMVGADDVWEIRKEYAKKHPVLGYADLGYFIGFAAVFSFFKHPMSATDPTLIALAVMCLCASVGFCGLNIWNEFRYLRERRPEYTASLAVFCVCHMGVKLCWFGMTYQMLRMFMTM